MQFGGSWIEGREDAHWRQEIRWNIEKVKEKWVRGANHRSKEAMNDYKEIV